MREIRTEVSDEDLKYYKGIITHDQAVTFVVRMLRATGVDTHYEGRSHQVDNALWSAFSEVRSAQHAADRFWELRAVLAKTLK